MTSATVVTVNAEPAIVSALDGRLFAVVVPVFDGDRTSALHAVANPDKLVSSRGRQCDLPAVGCHEAPSQ